EEAQHLVVPASALRVLPHTRVGFTRQIETGQLGPPYQRLQPSGADGQPVEQARLEREEESREHAVIVVRVAVVILRLLEPSPEGLRLQVTDPDVHGPARLDERVWKSSRRPAQQDRVTARGPPLNVFAGHSSAEAANVDAGERLTGVEATEGAATE